MADDLYNGIFDPKDKLPVLSVNKNVKTVEEKVKSWQERVNQWRTAITRNETIIIILCMISGVLYSYAVNECTGNFNVPIYAYIMAIGMGLLCSLLLIAEGSLPLLLIIKFSASVVFGHFVMMFLIVADGPIGFFTIASCTNPITSDTVLSWIFGSFTGYIAAHFQMEER